MTGKGPGWDGQGISGRVEQILLKIARTPRSMKFSGLLSFFLMALGLSGTGYGIELQRHIEFALKAESKTLHLMEEEREFQTAQIQVYEMPLDGTWVKLEQKDSTPFTFAGQWTWNTPDPVKLNVTDWLWSGDWFEIYDNGVLLSGGLLMSGSPNFYAAEPQDALGKSSFSQFSWILAPGLHLITIRSIQKAPTFDDATVAFNAQRVSTVPDSGTTVVLLGLALAGMETLRRKGWWAGSRMGIG